MDKCLNNDEILKLLSLAPLNEEDYCFNPDMVCVVRCKHCIHSAYPEVRVTWCKRNRAYVPVDGYCNFGEKESVNNE